MLHENRKRLAWALPLALSCACVNAAETSPTPKPASAASFYESAQSTPQTPDLDISGAMKGLLSSARGGGEVLRTWAAWKAGDKQALPKLFELAKDGNSRAQNIVGYLLDNGEGVRKNSEAAATYFARASNDFPLARYNLAVLTFLGRGIEKDEVKAMGLFADAVKSAGVDLAAVRLSLYYLKKGDKEQAWKWANEGANRGNVTAYYLIGRMLYERQEYSEAYGWLTKAAQAGEPNSPAILSAIYNNGYGMNQNRKMAASWWLIYAGLNRKQQGINASGLGAFDLTKKEESEAANFASNWLSTHKRMARPSYEKTLLQANKSDQS